MKARDNLRAITASVECDGVARRRFAREKNMKIIIRAHDVELTEDLRAHLERRLDFALGRYSDQVHSALVRFSITNGGRGGEDKRCQIEVGLQSPVRAESTAIDPFAAVDGAAHRAARAVCPGVEARVARRCPELG